MTSRGVIWLIGTAWLAMLPPAALAATGAERCYAAKLKEAGKYDLCRLKEEATAVQRGSSPDYSRCDALFARRWQSIEDRAAGDQMTIQAFLAQHTGEAAAALAGDGFPTCPQEIAQCSADLASCKVSRDACLAVPIGQRIATGSTTVCTNNAGAHVPCAGTGQDAELQAGLSRQYVDNGDGTISDRRTGLVWEKLSRDDSTHSIDPFFGQVFGAAFNWTDAVTIKIGALNAEAFAGYSDWRLPNINELHSIVDYGRLLPAIDPVFTANCASMCTVLTCSCTVAGFAAA
jgi:hypothetical protein